MDPLGWLDGLLWKGIRNSEKPCHLERNWLLIYFFLVIPLCFGKQNLIIFLLGVVAYKTKASF